MTTSGPDDHPLVDPRVDRAWREISREEPGALLDAALLAAAHRDAGAGPQRLDAREAKAARRQWWPLAAAATVAALAVGVLQLTPREELDAPLAERAVVSDMPAPVAKVAPQSAVQVPPTDETKQAHGNDAPVRKEISRADVSHRPAPAPGAPELPARAPSAPEPKRQAVAPLQVSPPAAEPFPGAPKLAADAAKPSAAPLGEPVSPQETPRSPAAASNMSTERAAPPRDAAASAGTVAPSMAPAPRTEASAPRMSERASGAVAPAPLAKMAAGPAADTGTSDARIKDRTPLSIPDWIALIRRLRDEGKLADATKELAAFRTAHLDHEKLLPPDLRDWRPPEK